MISRTPSSSPAIAFFDVDHTLIDGNSGYFTSLRLVKHGILKKRRILQAVYYSAASVFFRQDVEKIYQIAINDMAGSTIGRIMEIGKECFENDIRKRFMPEAVNRLKSHQQKGDRVVLLTSGPTMTIRHVQDFLGVEEAYTMGPEIEGGILTNRLMSPICHAEGKVIFAEEAARKHNIPLSECTFYSDHISDLPLLTKVGNPVAVNPDRKLKREALSRRWPILRFER
ncbi:MAG: HAD family hydrolase [Deltaproteobacteria bacterium]|nr:HAD family hydrolase [Deltaproteobacteria bacterium]